MTVRQAGRCVPPEAAAILDRSVRCAPSRWPSTCIATNHGHSASARSTRCGDRRFRSIPEPSASASISCHVWFPPFQWLSSLVHRTRLVDGCKLSTDGFPNARFHAISSTSAPRGGTSDSPNAAHWTETYVPICAGSHRIRPCPGPSEIRTHSWKSSDRNRDLVLASNSFVARNGDVIGSPGHHARTRLWCCSDHALTGPNSLCGPRAEAGRKAATVGCRCGLKTRNPRSSGSCGCCPRRQIATPRF